MSVPSESTSALDLITLIESDPLVFTVQEPQAVTPHSAGNELLWYYGGGMFLWMPSQQSPTQEADTAAASGG